MINLFKQTRVSLFLCFILGCMTTYTLIPILSNNYFQYDCNPSDDMHQYDEECHINNIAWAVKEKNDFEKSISLKKLVEQYQFYKRNEEAVAVLNWAKAVCRTGHFSENQKYICEDF